MGNDSDHRGQDDIADADDNHKPEKAEQCVLDAVDRAALLVQRPGRSIH